MTSVLESHKHESCLDSDGQLFVKGYQNGDWIIMSLLIFALLQIDKNPWTIFMIYYQTIMVKFQRNKETYWNI